MSYRKCYVEKWEQVVHIVFVYDGIVYHRIVFSCDHNLKYSFNIVSTWYSYRNPTILV